MHWIQFLINPRSSDRKGGGRIGPRLFFVALVLAFPVAVDAAGAAEPLHDDPQWLRMGNWRPHGNAWLSEVDNRDWFLAPSGRRSPSSELTATRRALALPADAVTDPNLHPACRFPARRVWLWQRDGQDPAPQAPANCPALQKFIDRADPVGVTMVFSGYYIGDPASAFGHTFLRIDRNPKRTQGERQELLDLGVDFSAQTGGDGPLAYAFKGMSGAYTGRFNFLPYYFKVREYSDYESRDIWEYRLSLRPDELLFLVLHLWELSRAEYDYFFFEENCSYHILTALEAAVPRIDLIRHLSEIVAPGDTIKALFANPGLVTNVNYRPALGTQFYWRYRGLSSVGRDVVLDLFDNPGADVGFPDSATEQARVLDAVIDLVDLRFADELVFGAADHPVAITRHTLLSRRAQIAVTSYATVPRPDHERPERGVAPRQFGFQSGVRDGDPVQQLYVQLGWHHLADPDDGLPRLGEVRFIEAELELNITSRTPWVNRLRFVDLSTLAPFSRVEPNLSWTGAIGAERIRDDRCDECLAGIAQLGSGLTAAGVRGRGALAFLAGPNLLWHEDLAGIGSAGLRIEAVAELLLRLELSQDTTLVGRLRGHTSPWQEHPFLVSSESRFSWHVGKAVTLDIHGRTSQTGYVLTGGAKFYY